MQTEDDGQERAHTLFLSLCMKGKIVKTIELGFPRHINITIDEAEEYLARHITNMVQEINAAVPTGRVN